MKKVCLFPARAKFQFSNRKPVEIRSRHTLLTKSAIDLSEMLFKKVDE